MDNQRELGFMIDISIQFSSRNLANSRPITPRILDNNLMASNVVSTSSLQSLPTDIFIHQILNLLDLTSRVRAAAVCRAWRRIFRAVRPLIGMPLWIWSARREFIRYCDNSNGTEASFLVNLVSSTTREPSNLHALYAQRFFCCRGGGLNLTMSGSNNYPYSVEIPTDQNMLHEIYNPFTGVSLPLPSKIRNHDGVEEPMMRFDLTQISSKPPNCFVAVWYFNSLCICRPSDGYWIKEDDRENNHVFDMIFYKGMLCCITNEHIVAYDVNRIYQRKSFSRVPRHEILQYRSTDQVYQTKLHHRRELYLVESNGKLLMVTKFLSEKGHEDDELGFTVQRVDLKRGRLVPVEDLGDMMLLVGRGCSYSWSVRNKDFVYERSEFFTKNCIYFFTEIADCDISRELVRVGKYRVNREEVEELGASTFEVHPDYGFEGLKWGPVWFAPSFLTLG